ncbi:MAG: YicC/YloC family endoribonuclease [Flavobacterium sp.]
MILSMTGFGKTSKQLPSKKVTVEIKSLNSKGLDLNVRMPSLYREMELDLRNRIGQKLERGKVDISIYVEVTGEETSSKINVPIVKGYIQQMREVIPNADATELMKMAVRMPDALKTERDDIDENEWNEILKVVDEALQNIQQFRIDEGVSLEKEFRLRIGNILASMHEAIGYEVERVETVKTKLRTALEELQTNVDENRFEQELIFYLEKYDITEEKVRLENHLNYFIETIAGEEANGRKLGFITQEIGREINTMGSKANHAGMQKLVVMMKDELEKIKEQVLNVL